MKQNRRRYWGHDLHTGRWHLYDESGKDLGYLFGEHASWWGCVYPNQEPHLRPTSSLQEAMLRFSEHLKSMKGTSV